MENPITTNVPETALLVFSEVYSNGQNTGSSNESGSEFIEIYNRSNQTIDLTEYQLSRPDTAAHFGLSDGCGKCRYVLAHAGPSTHPCNSDNLVNVSGFVPRG